MIKLFQPSDKLFSSNGDVVILPIKAKVHKEDNGDYYLDIVTGLEYAEFIAEGAILVADTPQGEQAFRVTNPQKDMHKITARAWQVFYDTENYVITDYQFENKDLAEILAELNDHATPESPFTTFTDEPFFGTGRFTMTSLYDAIIELINGFGGHLIRDNFSFGINQSIGADNGVTVEYRKNLKELSCSEVWDNVVTKILPVGKDGIMLDAVDTTESIYIDAPIQYDIPYCKIVQFEQDINQEDYETEEAYTLALVNDLRQQATAYLNVNCIPQVNYTLKANLERLTDVGDIIEVRDHRLGIDILTNVISFDYDCILGKYTEIEFGNALPKLSNLVSTITADASKGVDAKVAQATAPIQQDIKHISDKMSDGYVIYDGDKILVLDALPKESAQNVMKITNDGISFSSTGINGTFTLAWSLADVVNLSNIDFLNWSIRSFELSSGDDLDDIVTPNFYVGDTSDGYTNCPLQSGAFLMLVAEAGKSGQLMQYIISCDQSSPTIQMRFYDNSTWGSWVSAGGGGQTYPTMVAPDIINGTTTPKVITGALLKSRFDACVPTSAVGSASGVCPLNSSSKVDSTYLPSTMPPASHAHGNLQDSGILQTTDVAIASGDKLVITDSSDSSKVARASLTFDGATDSQALTKKGTWVYVLRGISTIDVSATPSAQTVTIDFAEQNTGDEIDVTIPQATTTKAGVMSSTDKVKLDSAPDTAITNAEIDAIIV